MRISTRLGVVFVALLAALGIVAGVGATGMLRVAAISERVAQEDWERSRAADELRDAARAALIAALSTLRRGEPTPLATLRQRMEPEHERMRESAGQLERLAREPTDLHLAQRIGEASTGYLAALAELVALAETGRHEQSEGALRDAVQPRFDTLIRVLDESSARQLAVLAAGDARQLGAIESTSVRLVVLGIGSVLLGALLAWAVTRGLSRSIGGAVTIARQIAAGKLDARIESDRDDDVGQLLRALADVQARLRGTSEQVVHSAGAISRAASRLAAGADQDLLRSSTRAEVAGAGASRV